MEPLTRQRTRDSIFSWWSDSNPGLQGATINLHTLAKPLMRRMYDRDALNYIQKHRWTPLSSEIVEVYLSYLLWKYVSPSTKDKIMKDITERVKFETDALTVAHSNILPNIRALLPLKSVEGAVLALSQHPSTALIACLSLVDLLSDDDTLVVHFAWSGLSRIAKSSRSGAEAVVKTKVLGNVRRGLSSPIPKGFVDDIILALVGRESTALAAILPLVDLLSDDDFDVVGLAWKGLEHITWLSGGAEAVLDTKVLDHLHRGLSSPIAKRHVRNVLFTLTRRPSTALAACSSLIHLLSNDDAEVVESAWQALADIAGLSDDGAKVAVEAKVLDHVSKGLLSPIVSVRYSACRTVSYVAGFISTLPAAIASPEVFIGANSNAETAWRIGLKIATSLEGAKALVEANVLDLVPRALLSPDIDVRSSACQLLEELVEYESIFPNLIRAIPEFLGVFALFNNVDIIQRAWRIVSRIATSPLGAEALVNANVLNLVLLALLSPDTDAQLSVCNVVERLTGHESTFPVVIRALPGFLGVFALFNDVNVIQRAWHIVSRIATSPLGAEALVKANVLDLVPAALLSPDARSTACQLVERLARHESTMPAVICILPEFLSVCTLFHDVDVQSACHIVLRIATSLGGAKALVEANVLDLVSGALSSPDARSTACQLLERLVGHESTMPTVIRAIPELLGAFALFNNINVIQRAWRIVLRIATSLGGAKALVEANVLDLVPPALLSADIHVRSSACQLLEELVGYEPIFPDVIRAIPEFLGVFALFNNVDIIQRAWRIVLSIATSPLGAEALVEANVLDLVPRALLSPVRSSACQLLERLVGHEPIFPDIIRALPELLGVFALFNNGDVIQRAWRIVLRIATSFGGAKALVEANVLDLVPGALSLPDARSAACQLLEILVGHELTMPAVMHALPNFFVTFVNLLDDAHGSDFGSALVVISYIAQSSEGAEAAVAANILSIMTRWLLSSDPVLKARAYDLLDRLRGYDRLGGMIQHCPP